MLNLAEANLILTATNLVDDAFYTKWARRTFLTNLSSFGFPNLKIRKLEVCFHNKVCRLVLYKFKGIYLG